jgi:serine/threonine protein kinase
LLCVVKKLNPQMADIETAKKLFQREVKILCALQENQQIPKYFNYIEEKGNYYLIQEYIKGKPLNLLLDEQWSQKKIVSFLRQILSILKFLHQKNIIHRDIKPSNIIEREKDGKFVLIDFGSVKQLDPRYSPSQNLLPPSQTMTRIGTPGYCPPEQMEGKPGFNSDIYALGMTAIQFLTGKNPSDLARDIKYNLIWNDLTIDLNESLSAIVTKMVAYNPKERYQFVDNILRDLDNLDKTQPSLSPVKPTQKIKPAIKLWYIPAALAALSIITVSVELIHPFIRPLYYSYQGNRLLDERQPEAAIAQFQNLTAIQPNSAPAWKGRGDALFSLGRYSGALEAYNKAISLQPNDIKSVINKGKVLYQLGKARYPEALNAYDNALKIDPNSAEAWSGKGLVYIGLGQNEKAYASFDKAQAIQPDEPGVWLEEGLAIESSDPKVARESFEEALRCYNEKIERKSNDAIALADRGFVLLKLNRPQEALDSYEKALAIDENFYEAWLGQGNALNLLGKPLDALVAFNRASQMRPGDYQVWYNRGILLAQYSKDQQEALKSFDKAIEIREDFYPAWMGKGLALMELKRYNEALAALDKAKALQPNDPSIWANRGDVLKSLARHKEAQDSYNKAIALGFPPEQLN